MKSEFLTFFETFSLFPLVFLFTFVYSQNVMEGIDVEIFEKIRLLFTKRYRYDVETISCIIADLQSNRIIDRFYKPELLSNQDALDRELKPYLDDAESNCKSDEKSGEKPKEEQSDKNFFGTPVGISIIVLVIALLVIIIGLITMRVIKSRRAERNSNLQESELALRN